MTERSLVWFLLNPRAILSGVDTFEEATPLVEETKLSNEYDDDMTHRWTQTDR